MAKVWEIAPERHSRSGQLINRLQIPETPSTSEANIQEVRSIGAQLDCRSTSSRGAAPERLLALSAASHSLPRDRRFHLSGYGDLRFDNSNPVLDIT